MLERRNEKQEQDTPESIPLANTQQHVPTNSNKVKDDPEQLGMFTGIPEELILKIFLNLSPKEILVSRWIHTQFAHLLKHNEIWHTKFKIYFPHLLNSLEKFYHKMSNARIGNLDAFWFHTFWHSYRYEYKEFYVKDDDRNGTIQPEAALYPDCLKMFTLVKEIKFAETCWQDLYGPKTKLPEDDTRLLALQEILKQRANLVIWDRNLLTAQGWAIKLKCQSVMNMIYKLFNNRTYDDAIKYHQPLEKIQTLIQPLLNEHGHLTDNNNAILIAVRYGNVEALGFLLNKRSEGDLYDFTTDLVRAELALSDGAMCAYIETIQPGIVDAGLITLMVNRRNFPLIQHCLDRQHVFTAAEMATFLFQSIRADNTGNIINYFLEEQAASCHKQPGQVCSPLNKAFIDVNIAAMRLLVAKDATVLDEVINGYTTLHYLIMSGVHIAEKQALIQEWVRLNPLLLEKISQNGYTPLMLACALEKSHIVLTLLSLGADVKIMTNVNNTFPVDALYYAVNPAVIRPLELILGTQVHAPEFEYWIPEVLYRHGADLSKTYYSGKNILHILAANQTVSSNSDKIKMLLTLMPGLIDTQDAHGHTALVCSLLAMQPYVSDIPSYSAKQLLDMGAKLPLEIHHNNNTYSTLGYATLFCKDLEEALIERGCSFKRALDTVSNHESSELPKIWAKDQYAKYKADKVRMVHYRTNKILTAVENGTYEKYLDHGIFAKKKPSQEIAKSALTKLRNKLTNKPTKAYTEEEKDAIKAFPKLKYAYKRSRKCNF